ncbi:S-methyl-5-thioribose-1-phosphate isomerase [Coemansia thaxteri]|uniref:Methylthioribose-1-phosphate isomerase n=1 Tax=Coemansia thaxteri TaxID=2663907 RepID=A0A9W8BHC2_9FUNG|nr:S-methyl-5-thioribose-1-phosphate isomerase [Coemansia thaxteri]
MATQSPPASLEAIRWRRPRLSILDQLLLPHTSTYVDIRSSADGHRAIATMQTRGAPAIAIVAALSLAAELLDPESPLPDKEGDRARVIEARLDYLATSRPTAVNLFDAVRKLKAVVQGAPQELCADVVAAYVAAAEAMLKDDVADNRAIGRLGAQFIASRHGASGLGVLTHCNTGALATAGHGTALGIVRTLHEENGLDHVYFTETRPYNQGARLTAYELLAERIPATLVCDSAVSALLRAQPGIKAVVVGADRVARNGDTANKIGTYQLAIAARFHGRDFIVAAPTTSIDNSLQDGTEIAIEERAQDEVLVTHGVAVDKLMNNSEVERAAVRVAPLGAQAWNPSFDVTPAHLITAIVTERGVYVRADGAAEFDLTGPPPSSVA